METSVPVYMLSMHTMIAQDGEATGVLGAPSGSAGTTSQPLGTPGAGDTGSAGAPSSNLFFIMILMMAGILLLTAFSGRKERKKHAALLASVGKRDTVRAAGGIIGTIIEIKKDEVLLETDRASNTRIRVARSSISSVIESKSSPVTEQAGESPELAETK